MPEMNLVSLITVYAETMFHTDMESAFHYL